MRTPVFLGLVLAVTAARPAICQSHTRTPLIRAQPARFEFAGLPANEVGVVLLSPAGAGAGGCLPAPLSTCLGLLSPIFAGPQLLTDAQGQADFGLFVAPGSPLFRIASQGIWLDPSQPGGIGLIATNAQDGFVETLAAFNESFDSDAIDPIWQARNPGAFSFQIGPDAELEFRPQQTGPSAAWADDSEGGFLWREVWGDFTIETTTETYDPSQPTNPPAATNRFGGLLLRDPRSAPGARNWAAIAIGSGDTATPHAVTAIVTNGSVSTFSYFDQTNEFDPLFAQLRLVRTGDQVSCEFRNNTGIVFFPFAIATIPGLPPAVEVGMFVSSEPSPPDVVAAFRYVRFTN